MRVVPYVLIVIFVGLNSTGCSFFKKRPFFGGSGPSNSSSTGKAPAAFPDSKDPLVSSGEAAKPKHGGLIAGRVLDDRNRPPRDAYIRWVCLEEQDKEKAPIDVAVGPDGYFTIRGLERNKRYKLIARAKDGSRVLAGVKYIKAPEPGALIMLREDAAIAKGEIPEIPGPPTMPQKEATETAKTEESPEKTLPTDDDKKWEATKNSDQKSSPSIGIRRPEPLDEPSDLPPAPLVDSVPADPPPGWVPGIAGKKRDWPPLLNVPNKKQDSPIEIRIERPTPIESTPRSLNNDLPPPPPSGPSSPVESNPPPPPNFAPPRTQPNLQGRTETRVPSCVLVGNRLVNFALYDTSGEPWEYKKDRRGRLVLLDFWGTWCPPCRKAVPELAKLQATYRQWGLEVVGIAYERGGTRQQQAGQVASMSARLGGNYRQLISGAPSRPVVSQFHVQSFPTLILLDQNGNVVWRHKGALNAYHRRGLELQIRRRLGLR